MSATQRLSLNQATVRRASLREAADAACAAGIGAIGTWRDAVAAVGLDEAVRIVAGSGLRVSSHCRGGFFTVGDTARPGMLDDNRRAIDETAALAGAGATGSAAVLVLVAGGLPDGSRDLRGARARVQDTLAALAPAASVAGVRLAVEPLHPMYAADRAVVSTLHQALDLAAPFDPGVVGVVVDAFHVWWDPALADAVARAGREGRIASYQVSDWRTPIAADPLLSRGLMGDGHIDLGHLTSLVEATGYAGDVEVEVFDQETWDADPGLVAHRVVRAFATHVAPALRGGDRR